MREKGKSETYRLYISGEWIDSVDGTFFDDCNPFNNEVVASVANAGSEDAERAIDAAAEAFSAWAAVPPSQKRLYLLRAADVMEKRTRDFGLHALQRNRGSLGLCHVPGRVGAKLFS